MKKMKNIFAIMALVGVFSVGNAFASGVIVPSRTVKSGYSVSQFFDAMYDYLKGFFGSDDSQAASEVGVIVPNRKGKNATAEVGIIHSGPRQIGIIIQKP